MKNIISLQGSLYRIPKVCLTRFKKITLPVQNSVVGEVDLHGPFPVPLKKDNIK